MDITQYGLHPIIPEVFDSQMIKDYTSCPSKFYLRHVLGLIPKNQGEPVHFAWGTLWHKAMEILHDQADLAKALEYVESNFPFDFPTDDKHGRSFNRMSELLGHYFMKYNTADKEWRSIRREQEFDIECATESPCPYGGCGLRYSGRIDRIAERRGKYIYDWDYKTTSWFKHNSFTEFKQGFQMKGYFWTTQHLMPSKNVKGVIVDLVHTTKTKHDFYREEFQYKEPTIREWIVNVKNIIAEATSRSHEWSNDPERWPKNWNHCEDYSGCLYRDIHYQPLIRDDRLRILSQNYKEERWSPISVLSAASN